MVVSNKIAAGSEVNRVLMFDECVNHPEIEGLTKKLITLGLVASCQAAWQKAMEDEDGNVVMLGGNPSKSKKDKCTKQVKKYTFNDESVADLVFAATHHSHVIFISENTKNNKGGIYRLLNDKHAACQGEYSLFAVFKKGKTPYQQYAKSLQTLVASWDTNKKFSLERV